MSILQYKEIKVIGKGSYGSVYLVQELQTKKHFAIKRLLNPLLTNEHPRIIFQSLCELEILSLVKHKNIIPLHDTFMSTDKIQLSTPPEQNKYLFVVMDYFPFDLRTLICSPVYLHRDQVKKIMYDIMKGLNYLHSRKIIHRDIKPGNVLGNHKGEYCLCDFSLTRGLSSFKDEHYENTYLKEYGDELDENVVNKVPSQAVIRATGRESNTEDISPERKVNNRQLTTHVTTRWYRAPELILMEKYHTSIDMWGAGCIFGELLQTIRSVKKDFRNRKALFCGDYCYPLTMPPEEVKQKERAKGREHIMPLPGDQMTKIISILGFPSKKSLEFILNPKARKYIELYKDYEAIGFDNVLNNLENDERDLLGKLLEFSPDLRITAKQALAHPYFDSIRDPEDNEEHDAIGIISLESQDKTISRETILRKYCHS